MTENRLLATSLSKKELITKPTFVLLQFQLSTQLDKELVYNLDTFRRSAYISSKSFSVLHKLKSIFLIRSELSLTVFIANKFDSCGHKYKSCWSWFVFLLGYFICIYVRLCKCVGFSCFVKRCIHVRFSLPFGDAGVMKAVFCFYHVCSSVCASALSLSLLKINLCQTQKWQCLGCLWLKSIALFA